MATIRAALPAEHAVVGEIAAKAYADTGNLPADGSYVSELRNAADRAVRAELLVALDGDRPVGTVTVVRPGDAYVEIARPGEVEFRMLAVASEASGRGVGRQLVEAVLERARGEGFGRVVLCVSETAESPRRLYERMGFRRLPDRDWRPTDDIRLLGYYLDL
ncbi:GNAT family N-acetyltransferase [Saccharopolyspora rhizosphaerae]|uniref:GNAT family N-acetyltransferase n=1 Tax=Saccharopolyspora rhizosphaerae TaxID=2492662 RepID=A0A3R8Q184_9PSEU|nr:GNAT family N-acetyltransferase [Saccharopolyspora rhizosphaerae]RRO16297.1 GNAT family N-acetyltransferase [Saccharopolyspora rhizosphaerae]